MKKNQGIQILRALVFACIVAFHFGLPGSEMMWGGIECFFVLAAYFLTRKILKSKSASIISVKREMMHRIMRIYPMYIIAIILAALCAALFDHVVAIRDFVIHAIFLQNYNWMITGYVSGLKRYTAHTWTICIDIGLYFILLILFKVIRSKKGRIHGNIGLIMLAIMWRISTTYIFKEPMIVSLFPLAHADAFALGAIYAITTEENPQAQKKFALLIPVGILLMLSSILVTAVRANVSMTEGYTLYKSSENYLNHWYTCNIYLYQSIFFVGCISLCVAMVEKKNVIIKTLTWCGNYSYTAYLLHWPIRAVMLQVVDKNVWSAIANAVISLLGAAILETIWLNIKKHKNWLLLENKGVVKGRK